MQNRADVELEGTVKSMLSQTWDFVHLTDSIRILILPAYIICYISIFSVTYTKEVSELSSMTSKNSSLPFSLKNREAKHPKSHYLYYSSSQEL